MNGENWITSTIYKCPKCGGFVRFQVYYEADDEYGDTISIRVNCPKCQDTRVDEIDQFRYDPQKLADKIGT